MRQMLVFGVADPMSYRNNGATCTADDLAFLCKDWREKHLALEVLPWGDMIELGTSQPREGTVLGIVIAATDAEAWTPRVNAMEHLSDPPIPSEVLDLRLTGGIRQAMSDWELVRLTARFLDIDLPTGQLWLLREA